jgi:DNA-binding MarR family transcriptional regulator/GNAT superfamily N-acetyltransferase
MMADNALEERVGAVRHFNRFYTGQIGLLGDRHLNSPYSLAEVRVLYELAHREAPTATELAQALALDPGYLSRILSRFRKQGFIERKPSTTDGRRSHLILTRRGQSAFKPLDRRAHAEIAALLAKLSASDQDRLVRALGVVEEVLGDRSRAGASYVLRPHRPGDMGWVVHRHGVLYAQEYGWDERFEGLVADIVGKFIRDFDPRRERCWIAERAGEVVGTVFLVKESDQVARLRLLLVEPAARGLGIGARLVEECLRFARQAGYTKITLWTNDVLVAARHIYEKAGFRLVHQEPHPNFGHDLVSQTWELNLTGER